MFNPCKDYCFIRLGKQYTEECNNSCEFAKVCVENKELKKRLEEYEKSDSANSVQDCLIDY